MNWLKRKIINWLKDSHPEELGYANQANIAVKEVPRSLDANASLNFTVYNAIGGKVVEFRRYDRHNDRSDFAVYIIGKDEDFGQKISKIATLEVMRD